MPVSLDWITGLASGNLKPGLSHNKSGDDMGININCSPKELEEKIPFLEIILPYTTEFRNELSTRFSSQELRNKLHKKLLGELCYLSESVLHHELTCFNKTEGRTYQEYLQFIDANLKIKYPVLDNILKLTARNFLDHIRNILSNFHKDAGLIAKTFDININKNDEIEDIDTCIGDGHNGESTALIKLSNNIKIIYKPRNVEITQAYNAFIEWINERLDAKLKTFKCINFTEYGWLEFVEHSEVKGKEELTAYYYKAGILLAVALVLGSKDCHYENVIASGDNPVLIDHETIIQPVLSSQSIDSWEKKNKLPLYSVLESILIVNQDTGVELDHAGFGVKGEVLTLNLESKFLNLNTIHSQKTTHLVFKNRLKDNVPSCQNEYAFANDYEKHVMKGFSVAYNLFMSSLRELISCPDSPINKFSNMKVRYVWRPTLIYYKIFKHINNYMFMSDFNVYENKLRDLLSVAYKKDVFEKYYFILESEVDQMLQGDIPYFSINSSNCHFLENETHDIFQFNCIENIIYRLNNLSRSHMDRQIEHIAKWLQVTRLN